MLSRTASSTLRLQRRVSAIKIHRLTENTQTTKCRNLLQQFQTQQIRPMSTIEENYDATDAWKKSCYYEIDYTIHEDASVYDAVQRFAAFDIGCLVTVDDKGDITGVVSERDYTSKIALLERDSKETKVKEIATTAANLVTAHPDDSLDVCLQKVLSKEIRHLPILDNDNKVVGMISVKDLVKSVIADREKTIEMITNFSLGRGGHFTD
eukprot:CAMPEP_0172498066 /NCGR_PEP_ID=MMETSP1066-20121228/108944_1 /TAXON_ID=671091 /ORGANISM="Coscinodiscus wailesii, Strain CCMP2513" /LENGTH=208 /DNA_ID=CAMNT_0013271183 /DNA_START=78 /DNA_END=704 /DNA_ORIENTATION=-